MFLLFRIPLDPESISKLDIKSWMNSIAEPANKKILTATMEFLDQVEKSSYRSGKTSIEVSDLRLATQLITIPIRSFSPFYETFRQTIQTLSEAGICPHRLTGQLVSIEGKNKRYDEEIPPLVLSMDDLGIGFLVCLIPLTLSGVVFSFEVIYSNVIKTTLESLISVFVVMTFMKSIKAGF